MILGVVIGIDEGGASQESTDAFIECLFEYDWVKTVEGPLINGLIIVTCDVGGTEDLETAALTMQAYHGIVCNLASKYLVPLMKSTRHCHCGLCSPVSGRWFVCDGCRRNVPWCRGAADEDPGLCDDCAVARRRAE